MSHATYRHNIIEPVQDRSAKSKGRRGTKEAVSPSEPSTGWKSVVNRAVEDYQDFLVAIADRGLAQDLKSKGDASDVVQETLVDVYREYYRFEGLPDEEFKALLVRMMWNNLKSFTRRYRGSIKRAVAREVSLSKLKDDAGLGMRAKEPSPFERDDFQQLKQSVDRLPERDRLAVRWRFEDDRTYRAIGNQLGCSAVAARKLCLRAIDRLRSDMRISPS